MKFQKLIIHNIASIEDAVIDFEAQPLAGSEVFLITGKTGAGKSTILDAICLALYANTPRLDGTEMQGDIKNGNGKITLKDPRQLMRRNTGEAFVSLTFTGSNGVHYEAFWSVARAGKKVTGNLQSRKWQLTNKDTDTTIIKNDEVKAEMRAAIGLDFKQFCRTTMLAQGEFTRFLNSEDKEKAEILEKITGVDVYSKIGAKVYAVTGEKKQKWQEAQQCVEGVQTLSDEEIAERNEALVGFGKEYEALKAQNDKDVAKREWLKNADDLAKNVTDAKDELRKANEAVESEDFKTKETLVNDWNATIDARKWMAETQKAETEQKQQEKVLAGLQEEFNYIFGGQKYAENEISKTESEIKEIDNFLAAERDKAAVYDNAQTIIGYLNAIADGRDAIGKNRDEIAKEKKLLDDEQAPAYEEANNKAKLAKEAFDREDIKVKDQEKAVNALKLSELRAEKDGVKDLLGNIKIAKERINTLDEAKIQREANRKSLDKQKAAIDVKTEKSKQMETPIRDAEIKMDVRKEDLDKQKDTIDKFASALRLKLHVGDTCPVCRQKIKDELPHEDELSALVGELQKAYNDAEKAYNDLFEAKMRLDTEIKTETRGYEENKKAFDDDKSVAEAEKKAKEACKLCGIDSLDSDTLSALSKLEDSTTNKFTSLNDKIKEGEAKEQQAKKERKALDKKRTEVDDLAKKATDAERRVNECKNRISNAETLVESKEDEVAKAEQKANKLITSGIWEIEWNASPREFAASLQSAAEAYDTTVQKRQELNANLDRAKDTYANVSTVITNITKAMPAWNTTEVDAAKTVNLLDKVNSIAGRVYVALTQLHNAEKAFRTNNESLNEFLLQHESLSTDRLTRLAAYDANDISRKNGELQNYRDGVVSKQTLLQNANHQQEEHLKQKPDLTENDTIDTLQKRIDDYESQMKKIGEKRGAVNQELEADKENKKRLGALMEDAGKKKADYEKWSRMNELIGDRNGDKFRKIAQSYVLTSLIHSANSYMKTLTDRYTLKVTPGTFVISVEDAYQGYVSRTANTISGGESFLVSLSLALALSDIGQTLSVDTLFIDEGFGTLSGEPLQNAIDTLRTLHVKAGRHVGIISHVEELQERIPVQIQVNQEYNSSSSKINIVPECE